MQADKAAENTTALIIPNLPIKCNSICKKRSIKHRRGVFRASAVWLYHDPPAIVAGFHKGFADEQKANKNSA